jgi:hypothetical protein
MQVVISPDVPRYVLSNEIMPGLPWPPGFKQEVDAWALEVCGTHNLLGDTVLIMNEHTLVMSKQTYAQLSLSLAKKPATSEAYGATLTTSNHQYPYYDRPDYTSLHL